MENCVLRMGGMARWSASGPLMIGRENLSYSYSGNYVTFAGRLNFGDQMVWRG
jgi:hypothetical protein